MRGVKKLSIATPLGQVVAAGSDLALHFLAFADDPLMERFQIVPEGSTLSLLSIKNELGGYFDGSLREFKTPIQLEGTPFQQLAHRALIAIPYGQTMSYAQQASAMERGKASRAVGSANGKNPLAIIVPCHRIIQSSGAIGGYRGGIARKKWLLNHEKRFK